MFYIKGKYEREMNYLKKLRPPFQKVEKKNQKGEKIVKKSKKKVNKKGRRKVKKYKVTSGFDRFTGSVFRISCVDKS